MKQIFNKLRFFPLLPIFATTFTLFENGICMIMTPFNFNESSELASDNENNSIMESQNPSRDKDNSLSNQNYEHNINTVPGLQLISKTDSFSLLKPFNKISHEASFKLPACNSKTNNTEFISEFNKPTDGLIQEKEPIAQNSNSGYLLRKRKKVNYNYSTKLNKNKKKNCNNNPDKLSNLKQIANNYHKLNTQNNKCNRWTICDEGEFLKDRVYNTTEKIKGKSNNNEIIELLKYNNDISKFEDEEFKAKLINFTKYVLYIPSADDSSQKKVPSISRYRSDFQRTLSKSWNYTVSDKYFTNLFKSLNEKENEIYKRLMINIGSLPMFHFSSQYAGNAYQFLEILLFRNLLLSGKIYFMSNGHPYSVELMDSDKNYYTGVVKLITRINDILYSLHSQYMKNIDEIIYAIPNENQKYNALLKNIKILICAFLTKQCDKEVGSKIFRKILWNINMGLPNVDETISLDEKYSDKLTCPLTLYDLCKTYYVTKLTKHFKLGKIVTVNGWRCVSVNKSKNETLTIKLASNPCILLQETFKSKKSKICRRSNKLVPNSGQSEQEEQKDSSSEESNQ